MLKQRLDALTDDQVPFLYGVDNAWVIAPTRPGAHNWEYTGFLSALAGAAAVRKTVLQIGRVQGADVQELPVPDTSRILYTGHSMGGHGALVLATRAPERMVGLAPLGTWIKKEEYGDSNRFFVLDLQNEFTEPDLKAILESSIAENSVEPLLDNVRGSSGLHQDINSMMWAADESGDENVPSAEQGINILADLDWPSVAKKLKLERLQDEKSARPPTASSTSCPSPRRRTAGTRGNTTTTARMPTRVKFRVGAKDGATPPWYSRRLARSIASTSAGSIIPIDFEETAGKEHWWWDTTRPNDGGVVNDGRMRKWYRQLFQKSLPGAPALAEPKGPAGGSASAEDEGQDENSKCAVTVDAGARAADVTGDEKSTFTVDAPLRRWSGFAITATNPTSVVGGTLQLLEQDVPFRRSSIVVARRELVVAKQDAVFGISRAVNVLRLRYVIRAATNVRRFRVRLRQEDVRNAADAGLRLEGQVCFEHEGGKPCLDERKATLSGDDLKHTDSSNASSPFEICRPHAVADYSTTSLTQSDRATSAAFESSATEDAPSTTTRNTIRWHLCSDDRAAARPQKKSGSLGTGRSSRGVPVKNTSAWQSGPLRNVFARPFLTIVPAVGAKGSARSREVESRYLLQSALYLSGLHFAAADTRSPIIPDSHFAGTTMAEAEGSPTSSTLLAWAKKMYTKEKCTRTRKLTPKPRSEHSGKQKPKVASFLMKFLQDCGGQPIIHRINHNHKHHKNKPNKQMKEGDPECGSRSVPARSAPVRCSTTMPGTTQRLRRLGARGMLCDG